MAGLTLQQIRDLTRLQLDLEVEDLPDSLIDSWAQEGYDLAISPETEWDFFEVSASFVTTANVQSYDLSAIVASEGELQTIYSLRGPRWNLVPIAQRLAERAFRLDTATTREPNYFSVYGGAVVLWPIPDDVYTLNVQGHRKPLDWITLGGSGAVPDCPVEFHRSILAWVLGRAYLQQDDPGAAQMLEQQFANQLRVLQTRFMKAPTTGPFIVNKGEVETHPFGTLLYDWE